MSSEPPPFEVYCASCDVTFPVGTRRCIHCGGATLHTSRQSSSPRGIQSARQSGFGRAGSGDLDAQWDVAMPFPTLGEEDESEGISAMDGQLASLADVEQASVEPGPGRGLLRSFGSLIWIALLIVFTMYRTCGE